MYFFLEIDWIGSLPNLCQTGCSLYILSYLVHFLKSVPNNLFIDFLKFVCSKNESVFKEYFLVKVKKLTQQKIFRLFC